MSYEATILADSVAPHGVRLTTFKATFPRFILAEVNTHRMLSRNSASSRAIPPEKMITRVIENPFVPETFNARVKGMGVGETLAEQDQKTCMDAWLYARDKAVWAAQVLNDTGVDKSRINRLLEPWLWHTAIITATEWSNFFALRDHPAAQPEFQKLARMMREALEESTPQELAYGQWHLPLVSVNELAEAREDDDFGHQEKWAKVSAGRCFKVSYDIVTEDEDPEKSVGRTDSGKDKGHWSPLEHPAMAAKPFFGKSCDSIEDFYGNFRGWRQLRKFYPGEQDYQILIDAEAVEPVPMPQR